MNRQPNQSSQGHQLVSALLVITTMTAAAVIVVVTRDTAGLADLATLVLTISNIVPWTTRRSTER
ncbi:MAG TPA: hypothetical protein VH333_06520 [Pseudonocardiaceae bacterium]|jgi:hypothetical protein|nr:hypothetical protein [Pseudonocardiaceae bacterium]